MSVIVCDFDETLFPTLVKVIEIYNRQYNDMLSLDTITTYNLYESLPTQVADRLLDLFTNKEVYDNLQPYKGSVKAIQTLVNNGCEVYVATATSVKNLEWKEQLLQRYFPFVPKENLIRIHNKKLLNCDILIEDNLDTLTKTFAERICFNQPWNQNENADFAHDIYRFSDWGEIVGIINEIERKNEEWERNNI